MKIVGIHGRETYLVSMTIREIHLLVGCPTGYGCKRITDEYQQASTRFVGETLELDQRWALIHKFASAPDELQVLANNLQALSTMVATAKSLGEKLAKKEEEPDAEADPAF